MGFKQHISRTWQMIEQQVNDVPFRPDYEAARRRVSFEEAPLDCAEEKRKRVCARGERRMQRMEHCHDWAEKEQCDRSRESRVRTSELRRSRIENKNADLKRLF